MKLKSKFVLMQQVLQNYATILYVLILIAGTMGQMEHCNRMPDGSGAEKSPSDGRFRIRISGNPEKYAPGETYTISLAGIRSMQVPHKFSGFMLTAEKDIIDININSQDNVGVFQLMGDALTQFSEKCANVVTQTSTLPKSEIQVLWTAPTSGSGCITFRATVIEHRDVWYMDDGPLSKRFCENEQDSFDNQPPIIDPCCACEEAKYEVTFEGLWSRHTHPKDFPSNSWMTRFSDIIGASHTIDYRFWEYGQMASEGLRQVAEHGSTRILESELKDQSDQIRTIIKARGISYPNVTGKTFAVFRVDSKHHLVSLVSMIDPSPDWVVGVSGLELCLTNCSWLEHKVHNLYPWDVGTDSGPTYISPDQPTYPRDVIRRIRSNFPNDPRSPFYDSNGNEMKPLARLYISRQRLYEKNCEISSTEDNRKACETLPWGEWSECSVKCGKGKRNRQREYRNSVLANRMGCKVKLSERKECHSSSLNCETDDKSRQQHGSMESFTPECALTNWSKWSSCSAICGKGTKTKTRKYVNRKAKKKCEAGTINKTILEINEECEGTDCGGDISKDDRIDNHPDCKMTKWSKWSPCSVTCGNGTQIRKRNILHSRKTDNESEDPCNNIKMEEMVVCSTDQQCDSIVAPDFCHEEPKVGHCRSTTNRWYYDGNVEDCAVFPYTGCGGNNNNFMSREECLEICKIGDKFDEIPIENLKYEIIAPNKLDCKISDWSTHSCNATCGEGYLVKTRRILRSPKYGGKPCPKKLVRLEKCFIQCPKRINFEMETEDADCEYTEWSAWSPCTLTCGTNAIHQRTRALLNMELSYKCRKKVQTKKCNVLPCPLLD